MHQSVMEFVGANLSLDEVHKKTVLEIGSFNVNGTVRTIIRPMQPSQYLGVDMRQGPDVDMVCDLAQSPAPRAEGGGLWDLVVCAEMLEHVEDWRSAVHNTKDAVSMTGVLLITTRSWGFPLHEYPGDFWRYELADMERIFADMEILSLVPDPQVPGVFLKARPRGWSPDVPSRLRLPLDEIEVQVQPGGR